MLTFILSDKINIYILCYNNNFFSLHLFLCTDKDLHRLTVGHFVQMKTYETMNYSTKHFTNSIFGLLLLVFLMSGCSETSP